MYLAKIRVQLSNNYHVPEPAPQTFPLKQDMCPF